MNDQENRGIERGRLAVFETIRCEGGLSKPVSHGFKRPHSPDLKDKNFSADEDEDADYETQPSNKPRAKGVRLVDERLDIQCKWQNCHVERFVAFAPFTKHMKKHFQDSEIEDGCYQCKWEGCVYVSEPRNLFEQHLSHHCYHEKLQSIGRNMEERHKLPECIPTTEYEIPENSDGYWCEWKDCNTLFWNINFFFDHTLLHGCNNPKYCKKGEFVFCNWRGCTSKFATQYKLRDHIRTHTKEKVAACSACGNMYATKTKLCDHRQRQLSLEKQAYQCSQCSKVFPTERLLRDHIRSHINHYKCNLCDMTCSKPSSLASHIRYRHLDERPFKCNVCEYGAISKQALEQHLMTHCPEKFYTCDTCEFSCRSVYGLDRHYQKSHGQALQVYECHCCQKQFYRGNHLTKHLIRMHDFHWPSGHSRFRYMEDRDGIFRLQTVRYESIEVTQEMMQEPSKAPTKKKESDNDGKLDPSDNNVNEERERILKPEDM